MIPLWLTRIARDSTKMRSSGPAARYFSPSNQNSPPWKSGD